MTSDSFIKLYEITKKLKSDQGCPWDKKQTPFSLRETLIEETFEVIDAIEEGDFVHVKEELGDAFFNIVLISYCYEQSGNFTLSEVLDEVSQKLIRRHPHVFEDMQIEIEAKVVKQWDKIKEEIEGRKKDSVLDTIPNGFPPLLKSYKILKKTAKSGFDWRNSEQAKNKIQEELEEISSALTENNQMHLEEEVGDFLFAAVNYSRKLGVDPNVALQRANKKFSKRFRFVEKEMKKNQLEMTQINDSKMLNLWKKAKDL